MPITCAVLTCHVPAVVPAPREPHSEGLSSTRAAMGEMARALVAHEPQLIVVVSTHTQRHENHWGLVSGASFSGTPCGALASQLGFDDAPEAGQAIAEAARGYGLFTRELGAAPMCRHVLAPLYCLNEAGYRGPVWVVVPPWAGAQTEVLFGEALRQAAHASGQRWAVLASADMSSRLSSGMSWAQCARAACFDENFIDYLRAGDLRSAVGLEAHLADAAAEGLLQCTAVAAGAVAFRTRGHKQFGDDDSYPQALLYSDRAEIKHRAPPRELLQVARDAIEHELRCVSYTPPALDPPWHDARAVFVTLRHADGSVRGAIGRTEPIYPTLAEEVADCAAAAATRDYRAPVIELDELTRLSIDISVLDDPEPVESRDELDPRRYGIMVSRGLRRGVLLPNAAGVTSAAEQVRLALSKAGIRPDEPYRLERFAVSKVILEGNGA